MKVIFAGGSGASKRETIWLAKLPTRLLSFFEIIYDRNDTHFHRGAFKLITNIKTMKEQINKKVELFLDSGAFSAKSQGISIDIKEYIKFVKQHESLIDVYANLDVIGSAEKTWKNQLIMEKAGLHPIPVYHYGEDEKWLLQLLDKGYKYIAIGGMVKTPNLTIWLDRIWKDYLTDSEGMPKVKVHGFGLTSLPMMLRYPWWSVDSTSWVMTGRMGGIFIPRWAKGRGWVYDGRSSKIAVSNMSPDKKEAGKHFDTLSKGEKKIILQYIEESGYCLGRSEFKNVPIDHVLKENEKWAEPKPKPAKKGEVIPKAISQATSFFGSKSDKPNNDPTQRLLEVIVEPGISNKYQLRDEMNIMYFLELEKHIPAYPWAFVREVKGRHKT